MDDEDRKFNPVTPAVKKDIMPEFLSSGGGDSRGLVATGDLREVESAAGEPVSKQTSDGLNNVRENEENAGGFYSNGGREEGKKSKKKKPRFGFRRIGPSFGIFGILFGVGGMMMGAQTLMPVAIQEMIIQKFNSIGISSTIASDAWLDTQLNHGVRLENLKSGETENLFAFSPYQVSEFEKQGIMVIDNVGGETTQITVLLYKKGNQYIPVVGSDFIGQPNLVNAIKAASGFDNISMPVSAKDALADSDFKNPYTTASKAWRGGSSGWFDQIMSNITETKLSIDRNRWARYVSQGVKGMSDEFKKVAASTIKKKTSDFEASDSFYGKDVSVKDENGNVISAESLNEGDSYIRNDGTLMTVTNIEVVGKDDEGNEIFKVYSSNKDSVTSGATDTSELSKVLNSKAVKAASAVADGADAICAIIEGLMSIYTVVSAYQSLQFLNLISGYLEAVDKVKAGDGSESPVHTYNNNLTTEAETVAISPDGTATDSSMGGTTSKVVANKTGMESAGMANLFTNSKISPNDTSVQNVNMETLMSNVSALTGNVKLTAKTFETCGYIKIATASANLVITALSFIPIFGQGIKLAQISTKAIIRVAIKTAITAAFYIAIPVIAKKVANVLIKDAATEWFGEDLGNALFSGASKYLGGNGSSGGQGPGSENKVLMYLNAKNDVIAEESKYQRYNRNPFDVTSPYTFLGSLAYSVLPLVYSGRELSSSIKNTSNIINDSLLALMPTANAVKLNDELTSKGDCPLLETTGAVGDAFCNPYIITDTSTIGLSAVDVREIVYRMNNDGNEIASINLKAGISSDNFEADGYTIKKDSDLAKYITYCGQRTSQYGIRDASIAENEAKDSTVKKIIGVTPVLSDLENIVSAIKDVNKLKWVTGEACVVSDDNPEWATNKYYARYAENERLLENMNPGYKSTITAYVENYYKENPLDDSLEGTLARFSGMTKYEVEDTLALIEYYQFLEQYQSEDRYAFGKPAFKRGEEVKFDNENVLAGAFVLLNQISFSDVRNRSFAV